MTGKGYKANYNVVNGWIEKIVLICLVCKRFSIDENRKNRSEHAIMQYEVEKKMPRIECKTTINREEEKTTENK